MKKIGIYGIFCIPNNKVYIGQSINIQNRWRRHKYDLRNNNHFNSHLQNTHNLYGGDSFHYQVLEECSIDNLKQKEEYWINNYQAIDKTRGFNVCIDYKPQIKQERKYKKRKNSKKIVVLNSVTGEYLDTCESINDVIKNFNVKSKKQIYKVLSPTTNIYSHHGYIFIYEELYDSEKNYIHVKKIREKKIKIKKEKKFIDRRLVKQPNWKSIKMIDLNNLEILFDNISQAGRFINTRSKYIRRALKERNGRYKGYTFKYEENNTN